MPSRRQSSWRRALEQDVRSSCFRLRRRSVLHRESDREPACATSKKHQESRPLLHDDAATKLLWLALRNIKAGNARSMWQWKMAMNQFSLLYGDRQKKSDTCAAAILRTRSPLRAARTPLQSCVLALCHAATRSLSHSRARSLVGFSARSFAAVAATSRSKRSNAWFLSSVVHCL